MLTRRWYLVVLGLLATAALAVFAQRSVPEEFDVSSTVLMLPPETLDEGVPINPYLNLGGLEGISDVLSTALGGPEVQQELLDEGYEVEYLLARDRSLAGPVLLLQVTGPTSQESLDAQQFLLDRVPETLNDLQASAGVAEAQRVTSKVVTQGTAPEVNRRSQTRALLVAVVGGVALTYLGAALVDGLVMSRRARRAGLPPRRRLNDTPARRAEDFGTEGGSPTDDAPEATPEVAPVQPLAPVAAGTGADTSAGRDTAKTAPKTAPGPDGQEPARTSLRPPSAVPVPTRLPATTPERQVRTPVPAGSTPAPVPARTPGSARTPAPVRAPGSVRTPAPHAQSPSDLPGAVRPQPGAGLPSGSRPGLGPNRRATPPSAQRTDATPGTTNGTPNRTGSGGTGLPPRDARPVRRPGEPPRSDGGNP